MRLTSLRREIWTKGAPVSGKAVWRMCWAAWGLSLLSHVTPSVGGADLSPVHTPCKHHRRDGLPGEKAVQEEKLCLPSELYR